MRVCITKLNILSFLGHFCHPLSLFVLYRFFGRNYCTKAELHNGLEDAGCRKNTSHNSTNVNQKVGPCLIVHGIVRLDRCNGHIPRQNGQTIREHRRLHHSVGKSDIDRIFRLCLPCELIINLHLLCGVLVFGFADVKIVIHHEIAKGDVLFELETVQLILDLVVKNVRDYALIFHFSK